MPALTKTKGEVLSLLFRVREVKFFEGWKVAKEFMGALVTCLYYEDITLYLTS